MTVLFTIGMFLSIIVVYGLIIKFDNYTYGKFKYEFFELKSMAYFSISFALLYFGNSSYETAVLKQGDILDGQLMMLFGILGLVILVSVNIAKAGFIIGIIGSLFQMFVYSILTVIGFTVVMCIIMFFAQTRPVFSINSKY